MKVLLSGNYNVQGRMSIIVEASSGSRRRGYKHRLYSVFQYQTAIGEHVRRIFIKLLTLSKLSGLFAELNLQPG